MVEITSSDSNNVIDWQQPDQELSASDIENAREYENPDDFWKDSKADFVEFALLPPEDRHTMPSVCQSLYSGANAMIGGWEEYPYIWDSHTVTLALDALWSHFCWEGMTRSSALEHQQLVNLVGVFEKLGTPLNPSGSAFVLSGEQLWADLPGLQTAVTEMPQGLSSGSCTKSPDPAEHWKNLHALAARLSASGISDLRSCSMLALRYALEEEEDARIPMLQRLEAVEVWLTSHGLWLEGLACYAKIGSRTYALDQSPVRYEPPSPSPVAPGQLAVGAGITGDGISWERWEFWRSHLTAMLTDADENGQPSEVSVKARALLRFIGIE